MNGHKLNDIVGEDIERILWDNGCDFKLEGSEEDEWWDLHVTFGDNVVVLGEIFFVEDGKWAVDPITLTMTLIVDGTPYASDTAIVGSAQEVAERILYLGDNLSPARA